MDRVRSVMTLSNKHKAIYAEYSYLWMESRDTIQFNLNRIQGASHCHKNSVLEFVEIELS